MNKKLEDLTSDEAKELIGKITLHNKQLEIRKIGLKQQRDRKLDEKKSIKDAKTKRMASLNEDIKKTSGKIYKDRKRKSKQRESDSFDRRIESKDKEIQRVRDEITKIDMEKAKNNALKASIQNHVGNLKSN
ncbi:hypothetical protein [Draconibacterium sediminis]|uniref:hypothetical protein n=1 Tax=Draconibacterium sediminis TaxID=1544798 RepID=UPI0026EC0A7B|nr:hypothetical protein [Draconibacterium sediminis]